MNDQVFRHHQMLIRALKRTRSPESSAVLQATLALEIAEAMETAASELVNALLMRIRATPGWLTLNANVSDLQSTLKVLQAEISR